VKFVKMQATGNDFILIDARNIKRDWQKLAQAMCDRHFGVGADGLILILPSEVANFRMRMFNPDGSEAEVCGNGLRCFAKYVVENGLAQGGRKGLAIETLAGVRTVLPLLAKGKVTRVQVSMGRPMLRAEDISVHPEKMDEKPPRIVDYPVSVEGRKLLLTCLSLGNPHAVCFIDEPVSNFPLAEIGPTIENYSLFPNRTNFEVARVISRSEIEARVWERGVGETLSCGSGACAIAVAAQLHDYIDNQVDITLSRGKLRVDWDGAGEVWLTGPVELGIYGDWPGK